MKGLYGELIDARSKSKVSNKTHLKFQVNISLKYKMTLVFSVITSPFFRISECFSPQYSTHIKLLKNAKNVSIF